MINETVWYPDGQSDFDYDSLRELTSSDYAEILKFLLIKSRDLLCVKVEDNLMYVRAFIVEDGSVGVFTWYKQKKDFDDCIWLSSGDLKFFNRIFDANILR